MFLIFCFVLNAVASDAFASKAAGFDAGALECIQVRAGDRVLFTPDVTPEGEYALGSVWLSNGASPQEAALNYLGSQGLSNLPLQQHDGVLSSKGNAMCLERLSGALGDLISFGGSNKPLQDFLVEAYPVTPAVDMMCALITGIKETMSGCRHGNVLPDDVQSFACYAFDHDRKPSDKIVREYGGGSTHSRGAVWLRNEEDSRCVLYYRPPRGPEWMSYRYDVNISWAWPKRWHPELCALRALAVSNCQNLNHCKEHAVSIHDAVVMVLSGRAASFDENVWFAYQQVSCKNIGAIEGDVLIRGGLAAPDTYGVDAVWMRPQRCGFALCYRSDDTVFQFLPGAPCVGDSFDKLRVMGDVREAWLDVVDTVINSHADDTIVPKELLRVQEGDKTLWLTQKRIVSDDYQVGDVWLRWSQEQEAFVVYYVMEGSETVSFDDGANRIVCAVPLKSGDVCTKFLEDLLVTLWEFASSKERTLSAFFREKYPFFAANDLVCAVVLSIVREKGSNASMDGSIHPTYGSWARYMPVQREEAASQIIIYKGSGVSGRIFVRRDEGDILCYQPKYGPEWLEYRCNLNAFSQIPEHWIPHYDLIENFIESVCSEECSDVCSEERESFCDFVGEEKAREIALNVIATFSGRAAALNEPLWFAWRPNPHEDSVYCSSHDTIVKGSCDERGVSKKGTIWQKRSFTERPRVCYRSLAGELFQLNLNATIPGEFVVMFCAGPEDEVWRAFAESGR